MKLNLIPNQSWINLGDAVSLIARAIYPLPLIDDISITSIMKVISVNSRPVAISDEDIKILGKLPKFPLSVSAYEQLEMYSKSMGLEIIGIRKSTYLDALNNQAIAKRQHMNAILKSIKNGEIISHNQNLVQVSSVPSESSPEFESIGLILMSFKKYLQDIGIELCEDTANPYMLSPEANVSHKEVNLRALEQDDIKAGHPIKKDLAARNEQIRSDHAKGFSYKYLIEKYKLSKTSISRIINVDKKTFGGLKNVMANVAGTVIKKKF